METVKVKMSDGKEIVLNKFLPSKKIKAVIVLHHGQTEHSLRYTHFAGFLNKNGIALYAHDGRCHGQSVDKIEDLGYLDYDKGFDTVTSDLHTIIETCRKDLPDVKVFIAGHSFGSFVVQNYIEKYRADNENFGGAILLGSAGPKLFLMFAGILLAKIVTFFKGKKGTSKLLHKVMHGSYNDHFPGEGENAWLSRDKEVQKAFEDDHRCGFEPTNAFRHTFLKGLFNIHRQKNLAKIDVDLPILIMSGTEDPVGDYGKSVDKLVSTYKDYRIKSLKVKMYKDARHELLNELNKDEVMKDLLDWVKEKL